MSVARVHFTKAAINAFPAAPAGKRAYYTDTKTKGLVVSVTDKGVKSFMVYRWVNGRPERITLGRYSHGQAAGLTIEQARKAAAEANLAIAKGENPNDRKRTARAELTLDGLFDEYKSRHSEVYNRRPDKPVSNYRLYLSPWGNRKLSQIRTSDIHTLHANLGRERGHVTANIAVKLLRSMFNRAIDWELWNKPNPVRGVKMFPEKSRDRFLQPEELPRFFKALADEGNEVIRDYVLMSLMTGARRSNVMAMRFDEVSFQRAEWRIPRTKNDTEHVVPLMPEAIAILKRRENAILKQRVAEGQEKVGTEATGFVFPGPGEAGHLMEPKKGWRRILDRAELYQLIDWVAKAASWPAKKVVTAKAAPDVAKALKDVRTVAKALDIDVTSARIKDLRIHDLRRTLGSWQVATGANLPVIGRTLQHKSVSTTAIYARLSLDPVRESMLKATNAMMAAAGVRRHREVTPMRAGKRKNRPVAA